MLGLLLAVLLSFQAQADFVWDDDFYQQKQLESEPAQALRIFWWNINCGILNSKIQKAEKSDPLATNIDELISSSMVPDLVIFGEFCPSRLAKGTQHRLDKTYGFNYHVVKSNPYKTTRNGIIIYSRYKIKLVKQRVLEGLKNDNNVARMYTLLQVTAPQGNFYLLPLHLYNPWSQYSKTELLTKATGKDNDNYYQAESAIEFLNRDINIDEDPLVTIGDFNSAKNIFGFINMAAYSLFDDHFYDVGQDEASFPSVSAVNYGIQYPSVGIDHAFTNLFPQSRSYLLPLKGSDHYPLLLFLK